MQHRGLLLIGHLRTRDHLIFACRQVSVGEYCCRYSAGVCSPDGWNLVTFVAVFFSWTFPSNSESLRPRFRFRLSSRKRQIIGVLDLASKELTSMFAQGGLGDAEAPPELVSTKKKTVFIWLVLNNFCHVAAHAAQVRREFRLNRRNRCGCIPAVGTKRPTFVSELRWSLGGHLKDQTDNHFNGPVVRNRLRSSTGELIFLPIWSSRWTNHMFSEKAEELKIRLKL